MSVALSGRRRPAWTSGLARHANAGADRTPSFRTAFRVALVVILLVGAWLGHWVSWVLDWVFITVLVTGLFVAGSLGIIR